MLGATVGNNVVGTGVDGTNVGWGVGSAVVGSEVAGEPEGAGVGIEVAGEPVGAGVGLAAGLAVGDSVFAAAAAAIEV